MPSINYIFIKKKWIILVLYFSPTFAAAWMNLGIVQAALNKRKEAEISYKTATKYRKKYPDAYYNLGNLVCKV